MKDVDGALRVGDMCGGSVGAGLRAELAEQSLARQIERRRLLMTPPVMTREAFAEVIGLPLGVLTAQAERGYWPQITVGRRVFINVEAVRMKAAERAAEFSL